MCRDENLPSRFRELGPRARLLQLATGASRLISKTLGGKGSKVGAPCKVSERLLWCT